MSRDLSAALTTLDEAMTHLDALRGQLRAIAAKPASPDLQTAADALRCYADILNTGVISLTEHTPDALFQLALVLEGRVPNPTSPE